MIRPNLNIRKCSGCGKNKWEVQPCPHCACEENAPERMPTMDKAWLQHRRAGERRFWDMPPQEKPKREFVDTSAQFADDKRQVLLMLAGGEMNRDDIVLPGVPDRRVLAALSSLWIDELVTKRFVQRSALVRDVYYSLTEAGRLQCAGSGSDCATTNPSL